MKQLFALTLAAAVAACGSPGSLTFTTYGEDFIETGIPAEEFEDGWAVTFSKFLVTIGEIKVEAQDGTVGASLPQAKLWDVTKPGPVVIAEAKDVPDRDYPRVSYAISPDAEAKAGNASASDVELMKAGKFSVYVEGLAKKDDVEKSFKWGFNSNTLLEDCTPEEGKPGLTVPSGGEVKVEFTIHGDHLFLDDLQAADSDLRFDAIAAADANEDGEVTLEELAQVDLTTLDANTYGTGSVADVNNLRQFIAAQVRSLGHYRGEGECSPRAR